MFVTNEFGARVSTRVAGAVTAVPALMTYWKRRSLAAPLQSVSASA